MEHITDKCQCEGKRCTNCNQAQCLDKFYANKRSKDGRNSYCKTCSDAKALMWMKMNPERNRARAKKWQDKNKEVKYAKEKVWRDGNKAKASAKYKRWIKAHPEKDTARNAERRTRKTQAGGSFTRYEWEALKLQYNYTCLCCGKREPEIKLEADHIVPVFRGGTSDIDNIQPLCTCCNRNKRTKIIDFRPSMRKDIS